MKKIIVLLVVSTLALSMSVTAFAQDLYTFDLARPREDLGIEIDMTLSDKEELLSLNREIEMAENTQVATQRVYDAVQHFNSVTGVDYGDLSLLNVSAHLYDQRIEEAEFAWGDVIAGHPQFESGDVAGSGGIAIDGGLRNELIRVNGIVVLPFVDGLRGGAHINAAIFNGAECSTSIISQVEGLTEEHFVVDAKGNTYYFPNGLHNPEKAIPIEGGNRYEFNDKTVMVPSMTIEPNKEYYFELVLNRNQEVLTVKTTNNTSHASGTHYSYQPGDDRGPG